MHCIIGVTLVLLSLIDGTVSNCLAGGAGCGAGLCCSAYGFCGSGTAYCGNTGAAVPGDCRIYGCAGGQCCSRYGYCGVTAEHCGWNGGANNGGANNGGAINGGGGNCRTTGCLAGNCCSAHGFCGNTAAHCGGIVYNSCAQTGCGVELCCTSNGYCDYPANVGAASCYRPRNLLSRQAASIEGDFQAEATYYNDTMAGSEYSTCGISRSRSLDENDQKVYTAAINAIQFDPYTIGGIPSTNPICEKKALVKGKNGEILVRFVDRCNDCKQGNIALTYDAFKAVAGSIGDGHTTVTWHFI